MRIKRNLLRKKAVTIGAVVIALPLLFGFKAEDGNENLDNKSAVSGQTSGETVDKPFEQAKPSADTTSPTDDKTATADKTTADDKTAASSTPSTEEKDNSLKIPQKVEYDRRMSQNEAEYRKYLAQFEGRTVVNVDFEGASASTLPTVQSAVLMHAGDTFSVAGAIRDINAIRDSGYFYDAYQTFSEIPEGVLITYHMLENPVVKDIVIEGNSVYKQEELEDMITTKRGTILNGNTLHDNITAILEKYHNDGYIWMKVANMDVTPEGVIKLKISEGVLEGYKVKGNTKTKDYVILREMRQEPGQPFNAKLARRSMERVYNLGYFEDVNVKMNPGMEPDAIIMEINVQEKRTGSFGIGAGYNASEGLVGSISISDRNFLGRGDSIAFTFEKSARESDARGFTFSYRKPWLDKKETAATLRIYNRTYQYYDYDTEGDLKERYMRKYVGGEITLSRPFSEYSTNYLTLRQRKDTYERHISSGNAGDRSGIEGEQWRNDNFGTTRSIEWQHVTDTRDNIYNPTTGGRAALDLELGGLGGDFRFQKISIDHQQFMKAGEHDQIWAWRGSYGWGHGDMTEFNQFRVGGQNSLRGYRDDQFRGNRMFLATLEYRFPLFKKVQGVVFTDWGGAWNSNFFPKGGDIYGSIGLGIALNTPLGPFRLDYGRGKQGGRFHFTIGGGF